MQHLFKNPKAEQALETPTLAEVINPKSNDYLQTYYLTHKVEVNGEIWYKAYTQYTVENTTSLWFKESEVSWFEEE